MIIRVCNVELFQIKIKWLTDQCFYIFIGPPGFSYPTGFSYLPNEVELSFENTVPQDTGEYVYLRNSIPVQCSL